jgi:hypothetical protein
MFCLEPALLRWGRAPFLRVADAQTYLHWSWFLVILWKITFRLDVFGTPFRIFNVIEVVGLFLVAFLHDLYCLKGCPSKAGYWRECTVWPFGGAINVSTPAQAPFRAWLFGLLEF